jgi:hypothetical protein
MSFGRRALGVTALMMADPEIEDRVPDKPRPGRRRVKERGASLAAEQRMLDVDDPEGEAEALLADSDARKEDPAARNLRDKRVERRTSDDATPPPKR